MSRYLDSSLMSGLGARRRRAPRHRGRGILSEIIGAVGLGRRRRRKPVHRGRGILDILKKALPFVKNSGIVGHLAGMIPGVGGVAGPLVKSLGYGRRRRVHRRRIGGAVRRRPNPTLHIMLKKHLAAGRRRRVHHRRHVGRGLLL